MVNFYFWGVLTQFFFLQPVACFAGEMPTVVIVVSVLQNESWRLSTGLLDHMWTSILAGFAKWMQLMTITTWDDAKEWEGKFSKIFLLVATWHHFPLNAIFSKAMHPVAQMTRNSRRYFPTGARE